MLTFLRLRGEQARPYADQLASLRQRVFFDYPYLYEGTLDYERAYLETYFKARHSFLFLVMAAETLVGASTAILASEEEESFRKPFEDFGLLSSEVVYFGESILLPRYRGQGLGRRFFTEREAFAKTLPGVQHLAFCAVARPDSHPLRPNGYLPLDELWIKMGFSKKASLTTTYEWKDRGEEESTKKLMQYWMKRI